MLLFLALHNLSRVVHLTCAAPSPAQCLAAGCCRGARLIWNSNIFSAKMPL